MKTGRISIVFAAAVTLASIGSFGAATPVSADPLCELTASQCEDNCPDAASCSTPACKNMAKAFIKACVAKLNACQRKHPG